jgi:two-component system, NtrC family, response regulator AtoC
MPGRPGEPDSTPPDRTPRDEWSEKTTFSSEDHAGLPALGPSYAYLLVLEGDSSRMVPLPVDGEVVIGRAETARLRLVDSKVSRRHARVVMSDGEATLVDLDSQNGTFLNGDKTRGSRALMGGDTIAICDAVIVYHASARRIVARAVVDRVAIKHRAGEEIERSLRFQRPLSVLMITTGGADQERVSRAVAGHLRSLDVTGILGSDQLVALMPETDSDGASRAAAGLLEALSPLAPGVRVGVATCPADGCDVDTLFASARAAAQAAASAGLATAAATYTTRTVGPMTVLLADPAMTRLFSLIERVAGADLPVLVCGETGTGKELAATALHHWSRRASRPLVTLNCAALPENLVESELFGHEKGAFSGATASKAGLIETATGGTLFLDEIGELGASVQAKLLRVLESKRVTRVGSVVERAIDIRVVAATNRNLAEEVERGGFRRDLFFRLSGATIWLPPLRDRKRELPILAQRFLEQACAALSRAPMRLEADAVRVMAEYEWPGNVRELKNVVEYVAAAVHDDAITAADIAARLRPAGPQPAAELPALGDAPPLDRDPTPLLRGGEATDLHPVAGGEPPAAFRPIADEIRELERERMRQALEAAGGNQRRAAELIAMPLRTFATKVKQYGLGRRQAGR